MQDGGMALLPLALLLLTAVPEETRGASGSLPELAVSMRTNPRLRAGLAGAALFGVTTYSPTGGLGVALDLGVVLADRVSLFLHGELGSIIVTLIGSGALVGEYAFGQHFSAGLGAAFTAWVPLDYSFSSYFYGLTFPLRLSFSPGTRAQHQTQRTGLLIALQVSPGLSLQPTYYGSSIPPAPALSATLSVGYAWR